MKVKFKKFDVNARMPEKAHPSDFCYDVWAVSEKQIAKDVWQYGLGFGLQIDRDKYVCSEIIGVADCNDGTGFVYLNNEANLSFDIRPRSSVWKTGMILCNSQATIDENYVGEIKLNFYHVNKELPRYKVGDKIAQLKLGIALPLKFREVEELDDTDRMDGGFGSTGSK